MGFGLVNFLLTKGKSKFNTKHNFDLQLGVECQSQTMHVKFEVKYFKNGSK